MRRRASLLAALLALLGGSSVAQPPEAMVSQFLVTGREDQHSPTISPDGRWLVYAEEGSGLTRLMGLQLTGSDRGRSRHLYPHPAATEQPVFSPRGNQLAFVSRRDDALGDVYIAAFPSGTPRRVSDSGRLDIRPRFTPDGETLIFLSRAPGERFGLEAWSLADRRRIPPPPESHPPTPYPVAWAIPGSATALLYADDINGDGEFGEGDPASAFEFRDGEWIRISPPIPDARGITLNPSTGRVIVSGRFYDAMDIAILRDEPLRTLRTTTEFLEEARRQQQRWGPESELALVCLQRAVQASATSQELDESSLAYARALNRLGRHAQSVRFIERQLPLVSEGVWRLRLTAQLIEARHFLAEWEKAQNPFAARPAEDTEGRLRQLAAQFEQLGLNDDRGDALLTLARHHRSADNPTLALREIENLLSMEDTDEDVQTRALLLRAAIHTDLGLGTETRRALLRVLELDAASSSAKDEAASLLIRQVLEAASSRGESPVLALRALRAERDDLTWLKSRILNEEGRILSESGEVNAAARLLLESIAIGREAPEPALDAARQLVSILTPQRQLHRGVTALRQLSNTLNESLPDTPVTRAARDLYMAAAIEQGGTELSLGDPALAASTFRALLVDEPGNLDAIRGLMEASASLPGRIEEEIRIAREGTRREPRSALAWYRHALATSYSDPTGPVPMRSVDRAIELDPTRAQFHLLRGFLFEQRFDEAQRRGRPPLALMESAANAYEQGMSLVDRRLNPRLYADFVLNSANAALALQQNFKARDLYREREALGISIEPLQREFLFHLRAGIAHFQAADPQDAIRHFTQAEVLLDRLGSLKDAQALRYQLLGRRGLALMDMQRHGEAARIFERSLALAPPRSLSRVRTMRNIAFLQEREASRSTGSERVERLLTAQRNAQQALSELDQPGLQPDADFRRSGGLIDMDIVITTDVAGGGARLAIDVDDERRILHALLASISAQLSDRTTALAQWNTQLTLDPRLDDTNRAYYGALRAVTLSRVAGESVRAGDAVRAVASLEEALALTRFELAGVKVLNGPAAATLLLQATETLLSMKAPLPRQRDAWWMLEDLRPFDNGSDWSLLDEAAARLLAMPDPLVLSGAPLVPEPMDRARLYMVRALAQEQLARESLAVERAAGVIHGVMSELQALRVLAEAEAAADLESSRRLGFAAQLLRLRMSLLAGDEPGTAQQVTDSRLYARQNGMAHLDWLIDATAAIHSPNPSGSVRHAVDAMAALLESPIYTGDARDVLPELLFSALEGILLRDAEMRDDGAIAAWNVVDAFRVIRLRWLAENSTFRTSDPQGRQWLAERDRLLASVRSASQRLVTTPSASAALRRSRQSELERARQQLARHLTAASPAPIAGIVRPESLGYDAISQLYAIEPIFVLDHAAGGRRWTAVYTESEQRFVEPSDLDRLTGRVVALGSPPGVDEPKSLRMLTSFDYFESCLRLALRSERGRLIFRASLPPATNDLAIANTLEVEEPVRVLGSDPSLWTIGTSRTSLAELFDQAPSLSVVELGLEYPEGFSTAEARQASLTLQQFLRSRGIVQARINGATSMGRVLTPVDDEALAMEELSEARGRLLAYFGDGRQQAAITALRDVIGIKEALSLDEMPAELGGELLAVDYFSLANLEMRLGRHAAAFDAATRAVQLAAGRESAADFLIDSLLVQGDAAMALLNFSEAESIFSEVLERTTDQAIQYEALLRIADSQEADGRYRDAIATTNRTLALVSGDDERHWQSQLRIARILNRRLTRYSDAESLYRRVLEEGSRFPRIAFEAWLGLARVSQALGLFPRAEEELAAAAALAEELEDSGSRLLSQTLVDLELAQNHWLRSDYFNAFQLEQRLLQQMDALDKLESLTAGQCRDRGALAIATRNLAGLTAWALNDLRRAHSSLEEALRLAEEAALPAEIASTLNNIGLLQRSEARYDEAIASFEKALATDSRFGNRWGEAYALRNIGITLTLAGRPQDAVQPLTRAVDLAGAIGDRVNRTKALLALGDALRALGELNRAATIYTEAESLAGTIPLPEVRWRAIHGLALIELAADRKGTALELMSRAVAIVDSLRAAIRVQEFQDGFLLDKQDLYDELVRLHLDLGNVAAALESSERSRGRNFIDLLGNTTLRLGRLEDQRAVEREAALRSEIEATERRLGGAAQEERSAIENDLARLRQDYADFLILIRATDPQLASLVAVEPVSVAELQALLDEGTHLLVYHLLDDELVAWVVSADSIDVRRVALSADELRRRLLAARESIQTFEPLGDDLAALSEFVLRPLLPLLDGAPRLCIVPHRELHLLPFAALPSTPGQVLIDEMAVFFVPSASVLRYTVSRRDDRANQRVLAFGDPDLGTAAFELPFARKEADRLRFDFDNVTVRLGAEATEGWLVANLQEYGIIHIASHGQYDPFAPLLSSLLLAPDGESDGLLTAEEIFGLTLRADLIALSACQTGLGRIGKGDDIIGLNRAFVYAGTRQLLSTLWRVDDISTALLFKHFYRQMRTTDRAEALRQAQLILKARPEYRHPARWAGLVLSGDWQ